MAGNQGFTQTLNLLEVTDGAEALQNLGGGTIDADLRLFAGTSIRKSKLFWDRFSQTVTTSSSPTDINPGTRLDFGKNSASTYTDDDIVKITPINLIKDIAFKYIGFDSDGVLTSISGSDINYIRGESYTEGVYTNKLLSGGSGQDATANITVNSIGQVSSVEITNNGSNYIQGDLLSCNELGSGGSGFSIRIIGFPWRCLMVLNSAYDAKLETNSKLSVEVNNTNPSLNGTYLIKKDSISNENAFYEPNNSNLPSYDVNRLQFAHNKISKNLDIFDIDGDGVYTSYDADLIEIYLNNQGSTNTQYGVLFDTYVNANSPSANARRDNGPRIANYFTGIDRSFFNIDDTGSFDYTIINSLFQDYATNGFLYQSKVASELIDQEPNNSITFNNTNIIDFRIKSNPNYTLPTNLNSSYTKPYIKIFKEIVGQNVNLLDNFSLFGTRQSCETTSEDYSNVIIGSTNLDFNYTIFDKQFVNGKYIVDIVISGSGKPLNIPFGSSENPPVLTPKISIPVFNSDDEYAVFDSNAIDKFFLKTNPRTIIESLKNLVLFSQNSIFESPIGTSTYEGKVIEITTLLPDLIIERDDKLETENISNLNPPEIVDDGEQFFGEGNNLSFIQGSFTYDISDGYAIELSNIVNVVDETLFLRTTKYRSDRNLYYKREIKINGFISSYDPDAFNDSIAKLTEDKSPGIYISDSSSQITNTIASDFARKTRSFSSDYNPWIESEDKLKTTSLEVTINDLFWTTEISLRIGEDTADSTQLAAMGYETGITGETLDTNFNVTTVAASESYKLPTIINGEIFYIIMKKS